ncbi:hypothetical protein AB0H52_31830, partial [Micromonospora sp. NPDC050695]
MGMQDAVVDAGDGEVAPVALHCKLSNSHSNGRGTTMPDIDDDVAIEFMKAALEEPNAQKFARDVRAEGQEAPSATELQRWFAGIDRPHLFFWLPRADQDRVLQRFTVREDQLKSIAANRGVRVSELPQNINAKSHSRLSNTKRSAPPPGRPSGPSTSAGYGTPGYPTPGQYGSAPPSGPSTSAGYGTPGYPTPGQYGSAPPSGPST